MDAPLRSRTIRSARPVDPVRIVTGTAAITCLGAGTLVVVQALGSSTVERALAFVLGLAILPVLAAPLEWLVHRYVYHEVVFPLLARIHRVHTAHHHVWFPTWRYTTSGPARRLSLRRGTTQVHERPFRNALIRLAHTTWYLTIGILLIWIPSWAVTEDPQFLAGLIVSSVVVSDLFVTVHDTIHRPGSHRLVEAMPWFAFLDRHHWIHHVDLGANLNFLLPLGDLLFGTLRTELTEEELEVHGTLERAKAVPIGRGERAAEALG